VKKILIAIAVLVALPTFGAVRRFEKPVDLGTTKVSASWLADIAGRHHHTGRLASNVASEAGDNAFIVAIVGSAGGANGTFFRSETTFVNNLTRTQRLLAIYFPRNNAGGCGGGIVKRVTLSPFSWFVYDDIVADLFGVSGQLGSLVVIAVDSGDNFDPSASIDGASRIWTPCPTTACPFGGTVSQSFPPVAFSVATGTQSAYGLRSDGNFHTNFGIFNYAPDLAAVRSFLVRVYGLDGTLVQTTASVPACSLFFGGVPTANFPGGNIILDMTPADGQGEWYGFGSSNDNISGDNWSSPTRP
jgi:hypothetical protein